VQASTLLFIQRMLNNNFDEVRAADLLDIVDATGPEPDDATMESKAMAMLEFVDANYMSSAAQYPHDLPDSFSQQSCYDLPDESVAKHMFTSMDSSASSSSNSMPSTEVWWKPEKSPPEASTLGKGLKGSPPPGAMLAPSAAPGVFGEPAVAVARPSRQSSAQSYPSSSNFAPRPSQNAGYEDSASIFDPRRGFAAPLPVGLVDRSETGSNPSNPSSSNEAERSSQPRPTEWDANVVTLHVRNIPARYSPKQLARVWPPQDSYNLLYMPYSHERRRTVGCAVVNFISNEAAVAFRNEWDGRFLLNEQGARKLDIDAARTQGYELNLWGMRCSKKIMRIKNPRYRPLVFRADGAAVEFLQVVSSMLPPADYDAMSHGSNDY
jgi:hypothetical protein